MVVVVVVVVLVVAGVVVPAVAEQAEHPLNCKTKLARTKKCSRGHITRILRSNNCEFECSSFYPLVR